MSTSGMLRVVGYVGCSPITSPPSILMRIGNEEIRIPLRDPALRLPELQDRRARPSPARDPQPPPPAEEGVGQPPASPDRVARPHVDLYL